MDVGLGWGGRAVKYGEREGIRGLDWWFVGRRVGWTGGL